MDEQRKIRDSIYEGLAFVASPIVIGAGLLLLVAGTFKVRPNYHLTDEDEALRELYPEGSNPSRQP